MHKNEGLEAVPGDVCECRGITPNFVFSPAVRCCCIRNNISHIDCYLLRESEVPSELSEGSKMLYHSSFIIGLLNIYCNFFFLLKLA